MSRHTVHARDRNHDPLMKAARKVFPIVEDHHNHSLGYDGIWANGRDVWIVEIKPPGKYELTPNELKAQRLWGARYVVVQDEEQLMKLVGGVVKHVAGCGSHEPLDGLNYVSMRENNIWRYWCSKYCGNEKP